MRVHLTLALLAAAASAADLAAQDGFRFRSGVELVNVTATVTDENGRFVAGLRQQDFAIYENGRLQEIALFSSERVPVSLGILLDTSGSMTPDKMASARAAINRLVFELLQPEDELFFMEFDNTSRLTQPWTTDRGAIGRAVARADPIGGTALYDAVADALPIAEQGRHRKKALLVISDGNDANSSIRAGALRQAIRQTEVLVYALGVDGTPRAPARVRPPVQVPFPIPFPGPGGRRPQIQLPPIFGGGSGGSERVNADALRQITDDTGGRTEIVRGFDNLAAATARIADELSQQYYLGYTSTEEKDGRWHAIRVDVRGRGLIVRARRGYVAS